MIMMILTIKDRFLLQHLLLFYFSYFQLLRIISRKNY